MSQKLNILRHFVKLRILHPSVMMILLISKSQVGSKSNFFFFRTQSSVYHLYLNGEIMGNAFVLHTELSQYYSPSDD